MSSGGTPWSLAVNNVDYFELTIDWSIKLLGGVRYVVEVREIGTDKWTVKHSIHETTSFFGKSGTNNHVVTVPLGDWEIRVRVTAGSKAKVSKSEYRIRPFLWTKIGDEAQYNYYYLSTTRKYKLNYVRTKSGSSYHRSYVTYDDKYDAYPVEIRNEIDYVSEPYGLSATYDSFGRVKTITESENNIDFVQEFEYDKLGRLEKVIEPTVIQAGASKQYTREWIYDDAGLKVNTLVKDGINVLDKVIYNFDAFGRFKSEERMVNNAFKVVRAVEYNKTGLVSKEETLLDNNIKISTLYQYDNLGELFAMQRFFELNGGHLCL